MGHLEAVWQSGGQLWQGQIVRVLHVRAAEVDGVVVGAVGELRAVVGACICRKAVCHWAEALSCQLAILQDNDS